MHVVDRTQRWVGQAYGCMYGSRTHAVPPELDKLARRSERALTTNCKSCGHGIQSTTQALQNNQRPSFKTTHTGQSHRNPVALTKPPVHHKPPGWNRNATTRTPGWWKLSVRAESAIPSLSQNGHEQLCKCNASSMLFARSLVTAAAVAERII